MADTERLCLVRSQASAAASLVRASYKNALRSYTDQLVGEEYKRWQAQRLAELATLQAEREKALVAIGSAHKQAAVMIQDGIQDAAQQMSAWEGVSDVTQARFQEAHAEAIGQLRRTEAANPARHYTASRRAYMEGERQESRARSAERAERKQRVRRTPVPEAAGPVFSAAQAADVAAADTARRLEASRKRMIEEKLKAKRRGHEAALANKRRSDAAAVLDDLKLLQSRYRMATCQRL